MKAIVQEGYGSAEVLRLRDVDKPAVGEDDVLVRVRAASVNAGDVFIMRGTPILIRLMMGLRRPKGGRVAGWDVAGVVEAAGAGVTRFRPGDEVYGAAGMAGGAFAEFAGLPASRLGPKPANLTFEQAAAVPVAACTALRCLRDGARVQPGQHVLINNASGGVGTFAVQIAKLLDAEVTGVCGPHNVDMVRSIGADHVVDYSREDFTRDAHRYDVILDNIGSRSFSDLRRALTPEGIIIPNTGHAGMSYVIKAFVLSALLRRQGRMVSADTNTADLTYLRELLEAGTVTPVVDRTYPLAEAPAAVAYVSRSHVRGKVVLRCDGGG